jgi:hypothetical protein
MNWNRPLAWGAISLAGQSVRFGFGADDVAMDEKDGVVVAGDEGGSADLGMLRPLPSNPASMANLYVAKFDRTAGAALGSRLHLGRVGFRDVRHRECLRRVHTARCGHVVRTPGKLRLGPWPLAGDSTVP